MPFSLCILLLYAFLFSPFAADAEGTLLVVSPSSVSPGTSPAVHIYFTTTATLVSGSTLTFDVTANPSAPVFDISATPALTSLGNLDNNLLACVVQPTITANQLKLSVQGPCPVDPTKVLSYTVPSTFLLKNPQPGTRVTWKLTTDSTSPSPSNTRMYLTSLLGGMAIHLAGVAPSTTLTGQPLTSFAVTFTPATSLTAGEQIYLSLLAGNLQHGSTGMFNLNPAGNLTFAVGNCTATTAQTYPDTITINLAPYHCTLPAGIPVTFAIPAGYLTTNPSTSPVNVFASTSTDPHWALLPTAYSVGTSRITQFVSAVPQPGTHAQATLTGVTVTFVIANGLANTQYFYIQTRPNIFRTDVGQPITANVPAVKVPATVEGGAGCASTSVPLVTTAFDGTLTVWLNSAACAPASGATVVVTLPAEVLTRNPVAGVPVLFSIATATDMAALLHQPGWTPAPSCSSGLITYTPGAVDDITSMSPTSLNTLAQSVVALSNPAYLFNAQLSCPINATETATSYTTFVKVFNYDWQVRVSPTNAPSLVIHEWGFMFSNPMVAIATWYPLTAASLNTLRINPVTNAAVQGLQPCFLFRVDRMTSYGVLENGLTTPTGLGATREAILAAQPGQLQGAAQNVNWLSFRYAAGRDVATTQILAFSRQNTAGVPLSELGGGWVWWDQVLYARAPMSGTFAGYCSAAPLVDYHSSDDAFFGLLALLAIPAILMLLCCAAAIWWLLQKKKNTCCEPIPAMQQQLFWQSPYTMECTAAPYI